MLNEFRQNIEFDKCGLCYSSTDLKQSHIIPRFVFSWLVNTSATGFMRFGESPNLRVQDGWKPKMLCERCEQKFSLLEKKFAENCFYPLVNGETSQILYENWLLKFAVSVSWRVLLSFKAAGGLDKFPANILKSAEHALSSWRDFLIGSTPHPGRHEQHLLLVDTIKSTSRDLPENINRYLLRAVEIYVAHNHDSAITYAKMGKLILFGFVENQYPCRWKGTKINANHGKFGVSHVELPLYVGDFIMDRARIAADKTCRITEKQWDRITKSYQNNLDRAASSETIRALFHDVSLFGKRAFKATQPNYKKYS